ncbi:unnamed protein product [Strongylus vulgaris]|uniref:Uncharacterized protein n=1 Tax=Strongylus vulgaris TaxID=40348 RepID=A0A3P7IDQ8_STRVU|nr:unnamed protein product [Strongylus vulgaris]
MQGDYVVVNSPAGGDCPGIVDAEHEPIFWRPVQSDTGVDDIRHWRCDAAIADLCGRKSPNDQPDGGVSGIGYFKLGIRGAGGKLLFRLGDVAGG